MQRELKGKEGTDQPCVCVCVYVRVLAPVCVRMHLCVCAPTPPSHLQEAPCAACYEDMHAAGRLGPPLLVGGCC